MSKLEINQSYGRQLRLLNTNTAYGSMGSTGSSLTDAELQASFKRLLHERRTHKATILAAEIDKLITASRTLVGINRKIVVNQAHELSTRLTILMSRIANA